jgi:hypothetical protein
MYKDGLAGKTSTSSAPLYWRTYIVAILVVLALPCAAFAAGRVCDVRAMGATADGHTKDTAAIQSAIDRCASGGGGVVRFAAGIYVSAPLDWKSHAHLNSTRVRNCLARLTEATIRCGRMRSGDASPSCTPIMLQILL